MRIASLQNYNINTGLYNNNQIKNNTPINNTTNTNHYSKIPLNYNYGAKISFGEFFDPNRTVPHIDYEEYMAMRPNALKIFRKKYSEFLSNTNIDKNELVDKKFLDLPLRDEAQMDSFIEVAKMYTKYKDHQIICLGRSPKWFLNAALWMKDGIPDYKFVAFSGYWYTKDPKEGVKKMQSCAPTEEEEKAYKKYLKDIKADPKSIVDNFNRTGKTTIITDYVCSGKGASSFLDIMSRYAEEQGVLEEFSKAIEIVAIGCMEYQETFYYDDEDVPEPHVYMPERLREYDKNIKQTFYNIKDYNMFREMLLNQNTNECRSTYYPGYAWPIYRPDRFKTGVIRDMKKIIELTSQLKGHNSMSHFTPAMYDYRNLLNFRILDALNQRHLLKENHSSKI